MHSAPNSGEVERANWSEYLTDFSRRNEGRPTRLEVIDAELGSEELEKHLPLIGISFEPKGSAAGSVVILLGDETAEGPRQMEHIVLDTTRIVPIGTHGVEDGVGIESRNGNRTLLTFEALPELPRE